ncbi:MAG TPA: isoprenylcysteine carboxylmethyltransferase family protein [Bryobacteraceae bacterium]|nr:isoprenylcysteine carboxylmethyltransferase family protein [Bryobacteraceae bacterium]HPT27402.1 isoprenylcysteine carboxylmethyltransferase family protein [Bryobacteraceae bacterium]
MLEPIVVTILPVAFLAVLSIGGQRFRRRHIDMDGDVPISRALFYGSKYLIVVLWIAMVIDTWGVDLTFFTPPASLKWAALCVWVAGFILLFAGRFELGQSFRIGRPKESTNLQMAGLFRVSRNPMYLGVYATLLASVLRTLNPVLLVLGAFIVAVHHRIVLAEEAHLREAFGEEYSEYCRRVRRYI